MQNWAHSNDDIDRHKRLRRDKGQQKTKCIVTERAIGLYDKTNQRYNRFQA